MKRQTWLQWARAVAVDPHSPSRIEPAMVGSMMTGQDARMLSAVSACWEVYANADNAGRRGALEAVYALLPAMSPTARFVARELIPYALDWSFRDTVWGELEKFDRESRHVGAQVRALQYVRNIPARDLTSDTIDQVIADVRSEKVRL